MNKSLSISVTPVLTVHATYTTGDYVGTSGVAMVFAGAADPSHGQTGTIVSAQLIDGALQSIAAELWIFDTIVTPPADSAAWTISDADAAHLKGVIAFSTYYASALNSVSPVNPVGIAYKADASGNLYGCLVTRGAPAYASGDVTVVLDIWQD